MAAQEMAMVGSAASLAGSTCRAVSGAVRRFPFEKDTGRRVQEPRLGHHRKAEGMKEAEFRGGLRLRNPGYREPNRDGNDRRRNRSCRGRQFSVWPTRQI